MSESLANRNAVALGVVGQLSFGGVADAALWHIENAPGGKVVASVRDCH